MNARTNASESCSSADSCAADPLDKIEMRFDLVSEPLRNFS